jgi:alpha-L-fucosidase
MYFSLQPKRKSRRPDGAVLVLLVTLAASCSPRDVSPPAPVEPLPSTAQLAWHEIEMNAFVHFSINTFTDLEWGKGGESPSLFNPTRFDAGQWLRIFKAAGFKSVILTTKHHDGFCLWPSQFTEHSVKASPFMNGKGDVVNAVSNACRLYGLKFGIYLSPWDRNNESYGTPAYLRYYRNQLRELFKMYGPISEVWLDGANGGDGYYGGKNETRRIDGSTYYNWPGAVQMVRSLQPGVIFFSDAGPDVRWVGNERGIAGETNWNTITTDTLFAGKAGIEKLLNTGNENGTSWVPAETDVSIRPGWFYHAREDSLVKTPEQLFDIYLTSVGRGSTLLLNVPPDRRGLIHEKDSASLAGFKKLLDETFANDLAFGADADCEQERGGSPFYAASNLVDGNPATYWATDDGINNAEVEIQLKTESEIKYVLLQEFISLGQRVRSFEIWADRDGEWQKVADGTTIGYKRILRVPVVRTSALKLVITDARASPVISTFAVY